ncbi:MAG: zinc ribbon domain-containing protein [bacterium]
MNQQLEYLMQLQEIDLRIGALEKERSLLPEEIERLRQAFQREVDAWESSKKKMDDLEKDRRKKERELEEIEAKLSKYNTQLLSVKTNKEYTAMLHEIDQCKEEISSKEEAILLLFDQQEEVQAALGHEKKEVEEKRRLFEEEKSRIDARLAQIEKEIEALSGERGGIEEKVEEDLLREYSKLIDFRKGLAVSRAKDGSCIGCHIHLMPQLFQEIKANDDRIFRCPNCHRFLFYMAEDTGA